MEPAINFTGVAWGMLLAGVGLAFWEGCRRVPGLGEAVEAVGWLAGATLLVGLLLAWRGDRTVSSPILMAAVVAPPGIRRRRCSSWGRVMLILPALMLAGVGLFWSSPPMVGDGNRLVTPAWLVVLCAGLGARALGEALSEMVGSTSQVEWSSGAAYALLTLLVGGTALVNLCQRGVVWRGSASLAQSGLTGAWLAWSGARLGPRHHPRLRAGLTLVAASLLIWIALKHA